MNCIVRRWCLAFALMVVAVVALCLSSGVKAQGDCRPAEHVLGKPELHAWSPLIVADILLIDENEANLPDKFAGHSMSVREALYRRMDFAENAVAYADNAIAKGTIAPSERHQYVVDARRNLVLHLQAHNAVASTVGLLQATVRGGGQDILLTRRYVFANDARDGEMATAPDICIVESGLFITPWPSDKELTAEALLKKPEAADCSKYAKNSTCGSLTKHLAAAKEERERVILIARRSQSSAFVITLGPLERGRILWVDGDGTTFLEHRYANGVVRRKQQ